MERKTTILAVTAIAAVALAALPSIASAEFEITPFVSPVGEAEFPLAYSGEGEEGTLYMASGREVSCSGNSAEGSFTSAVEGSAKITFTECRESVLNSKCTTSGQSSGTIVTETLPTQAVYLDNAKELHGTPGILFTPNAGSETFTTFSCVSGFVKIVVKGSGLLGTVTEPPIGGEASSSMSISVEATAEGQQHTTALTGTIFKVAVYVCVGLEANTNGGAFEPAYEQAGTSTLSLQGTEAATTT